MDAASWKILIISDGQLGRNFNSSSCRTCRPHVNKWKPFRAVETRTSRRNERTDLEPRFRFRFIRSPRSPVSKSSSSITFTRERNLWSFPSSAARLSIISSRCVFTTVIPHLIYSLVLIRMSEPDTYLCICGQRNAVIAPPHARFKYQNKKKLIKQ